MRGPTTIHLRRAVVRAGLVLAAAAVTIPAGAPAAGAAAHPAERAHAHPAKHHHARKAARHQPRTRHAVRKPSRKTARHPRARAAAVRPVTFGIYPGGAAGTVGPSGRLVPEDAAKRRASLLQLRGSARPFVLHLYDDFTRPADAKALPAWLAQQIAAYTADDFQVELVLRYRPAAPGGDVAGFAGFVRARVRQLGPNRDVTDLQVTNEANVPGAPDAADGAYPRVREALVRGVLAAHDEAGRRGIDHLSVGFNWAAQSGPAEAAFFSALRALGGRSFARAVDWVGVDAYPGTWGPALAPGDLGAAVRASTLGTLRTLRSGLLPRAGLSRAALHVSESGFPTGPGRSEAMQETVLRAAVGAVESASATYGVTDYRWFDLRDADSAGGFESQYGLTRDDYSPKPAFFAFRDLVGRLG